MVVSAAEKVKELNQVSQKKPVKRNWLAFIAACLALQVCALLFTEFVLYIAGLGEEEIFAFDDDLGTKHMTNKRITWRSEGFGVNYFDSNGMMEQGVTIAKPANTYRIAVLGDSMVEGLQVKRDEKFTELLNKEIKLDSGKSLQILNFGTSGYSTAQEYAQLKKRVFDFAPDMVLYCYNSRDIFENWSPADATIANVRPIALHLPGQQLSVNNSSIQEWMKSPRGKFLKSISWIRQNSRIFGLVSAMETELSFKDETYKAIIALITRPKKTIQKWYGEWSKPDNWKLQSLFANKPADGPSFHIQFFELKETAKGKRKPGAKAQAGEKAGAPQGAQADLTPKAAPVLKPLSKGEQTYIDLMTNTLSSLVLGMNSMCQEHHAKFVVMALPARLGLAPLPGTETVSYNLDYAGEIDVVRKACQSKNIPFCDLLTPALPLSEKERLDLFYSLHISKKGHQFVAQQLKPFLEEQCNSRP